MPEITYEKKRRTFYTFTFDFEKFSDFRIAGTTTDFHIAKRGSNCKVARLTIMQV